MVLFVPLSLQNDTNMSVCVSLRPKERSQDVAGVQPEASTGTRVRINTVEDGSPSEPMLSRRLDVDVYLQALGRRA